MLDVIMDGTTLKINPRHRVGELYGEACEWLRQNTPTTAFVIQEPASVDQILTTCLCQRRTFVAKIREPVRRVSDYRALHRINGNILGWVRDHHHLEFQEEAPLLAKLRSRTNRLNEIYVFLHADPELMFRIEERNSPSLAYSNARFAVFQLTVLE